MQRSLSVFLLACLLPGTAWAQGARTYERSGDQWYVLENGRKYLVDPEVVTVKYRVPPLDVRHHLASLPGSLGSLALVRSNVLGFHDLRIPQGSDPLEVVQSLKSTGLFEVVQENAIGFYDAVPNDPLFASSQWNLNNTGQSGGTPDADVDAVEAWDLEDGDASVIIAVVDSGADHNHPDLAAAIWTNPNEVVNGIDDDGNGFVDDIRGWDFENNDNNPVGVFFHGSGVAGTVAAVGNNNEGICGLAGGGADGQGCRVMNLAVGGFAPVTSAIDDAILYAVANGAQIVTMSLTVPQDAAIDAAVDFAYLSNNVFIDCAAGNNGPAVTYPASLPNVMAIASTNDDDQRSSFSNPGPQLEVSAPGENITMPDLGVGYTVSSGTSFAAPHVAALAGLILSLDPSLTNASVRQILIDSADDIGTPGFDNNTGWGRINAETALQIVSGGFVQGSIVQYGGGTPGTGGLLPRISGPRAPTVGDATWGVNLTQALPSAPALLMLGFAPASLPFKGGLVNIDVTLLFFLFPAGTDPAGTAFFGLGIPPDAGLAAGEFFTQWFVADPGAVQGLAMSRGMHAVIGS